MAKKGSKNQTKQPIVANRADTSLLIDTDSAATTKTTPPDNTHVAFHDFIQLADIETIHHFLAATTSTLESKNLEVLWNRAYKEGFESSQKAVQPILQRLGIKLEEKYQKGVAKGMDLGREEGYTVAKEAFDKMVKALRARETPKASTTDAGTQTDSLATTSTSVSTQTNSPSTLTPYDMLSSSTMIFSPYSLENDSSGPTFIKNVNHTSNDLHLTQIENAGCQALKNVSNIIVDTSPAPTTPRFESSIGIGNEFKDSPLYAVADVVAPCRTVSDPETPSTTSDFAQNHTKANVSSEKYPETAKSVTGPINWADDAMSLPTLPTTPQHPPRDLSCLRSTTPHPFSSLRRRRGHPRTRWNSQRRNSHFYSYSLRFHHSPHPRTTFPISWDWDRDPRLADLSSALHALGWVRR
jgi:hypothetical protein